MNHSLRQRLIVGTIKAGVVSPSPRVAAYIAAREANLHNHNPATVKCAWDLMTKEEQDAMDALLLEATR